MGGVNKITRSPRPIRVFESALALVDATVSFNQGDLLVLDATANLLKIPAAESEGSTFLGVAECTVVSGKLAGPYQGTAVDAANAISDIPGPTAGVIVKCVLKTGDSLLPADLVYLDPATGTRGVTVTGTKAIGIYQGKAIASAPAGTEVEILLGHRFPADTLAI